MNDNQKFDDEFDWDDLAIGPSRVFKIAFWSIIGLFVAVLAVLAFLAATEAHAHTHDGVAYPPNCCNSAATSPNGDCAPIGDQYVTEEADGYHINLPVGAHPRLKTKGYVGVVPYSTVKQPLDEFYHICLGTDGAMRFCFFPKMPAV